MTTITFPFNVLHEETVSQKGTLGSLLKLPMVSFVFILTFSSKMKPVSSLDVFTWPLLVPTASLSPHFIIYC